MGHVAAGGSLAQWGRAWHAAAPNEWERKEATMPQLRWIGFVLAASLPACNCKHGSQQQIESRDSTPSAAPNPLDFGDVPLGQTKALPLTLTNTGALELDISSATIVQSNDAGPAQFNFAPMTKLTAPFGASLQPGDSATVSVQCQPNQAGAQTGTLVIKSNSDAIPSLNVVLQCTGIDVAISVQPASLNFGNVQDGTQSTLSVTLTNTGSSPSSPILVSPVAGTQASEFSWSGTPSALSPGQSFSLQVTFSPLQQGPASAFIPFSYCATCSLQTIPLSGVGVDGQLVYSPNPITFSNVPAGNMVSSPSVTLSNVGTAAVSIKPFAMQSGATLPFSLVGYPAVPITLQPGADFQFTVSYTASAAGNDMDAVNATWVPLDSTGAAVMGISPRIAADPVTGNGTLNPCTLQIMPGSLAFGNVTVGTPVQKSVTLTNSGDQTCNVTAIGLAAGTDPAFTLVNPGTTGLTIASGQNATIAVSCDVTTSGTPLLHKGALTFQSTDPSNATVSVPLSASVQGSGPYSNGWPKWHNDNTDQGQSDADTSGDVGNLVYQFPVGVPQTAAGFAGQANPNPTYMNSPVVDASGNVYQLGMNGTFYAVGPTGTQLWTANLLAPNPDEHPATPIIAADGTIYVETGTDNPSDTAQMYHLNATTGAILFQSGPPTGAHCDPQPDCYMASDCEQIVSSTITCQGGSGGFNGNPGTCCYTADGFDVNPSLGTDGLLFDGDDIGQLVTYTLNSGGSFTQTNEVMLELYGERVAVALDGNDNSYWCSLNSCFGVTAPAAGFAQMGGWPAAGATIGNAGGNGLQQGTSWVNSDLAYDATFTTWLMVEAGTQTSKGTGNIEVVAMTPTTGAIQWDVTLPSGPTPGSFDPNTGAGVFSADVGNSAPAIDAVDGTVYVGNVNGLDALVGTTGATKTGFPYKPSQDTGADADVDTAPAIGGDRTVFFGTAGGTFYAVNPDGTERYHYKTGGRISSSPAIGPDGTVYFVSDDGNLYALR
jgi:outer membrane protein assembly factor BamB